MVEQADVCRVRYVSDGGIVAQMASTALNWTFRLYKQLARQWKWSIY